MSSEETFQEKCAEIVRAIDTKHSVIRDPHLSFTQLMEEVGELAKEINRQRLRNEKIDREHLREEFADVTLQFFVLADILDIDIEEAVDRKIEVLKKRHSL